MDWMEIVEIKPHQPRKRKYQQCSLYRNRKTVVHVTSGGVGLVGKLVEMSNKQRKKR